ncbi:MAG: hypothetical protein IT165_22660 [Bryobacterales bacterium]|nr:hypothetical protein [Bryobacterales bacterium]
MNALRVLSGALDELAERQIVLRGVIEPASLAGLLKPDYQRETLRKATIEGLMEAFRDGAGRVPDVELAVRGEQYGCTDSDGTYTITGEVYIIDGLQRISAARQFASEGGKPLVGAMIHFATTEPWERERFDILNMRRTRLSPNVLLRNRTAQCPSLHRLYQLCAEESFVLYQRVSWSQYMRREELLTALSFLKTVMRLHSQFGAGRYGVLPGIWQALPPMMANVGHNTMVENIKTLFDLIDAAWGIRNILYKDRATHLKTGFLFALADVISGYPAFWSGKSLRIDRDMQKKIGQFGLHDPNVRAMACSTSNIGLLSRLIVDHLNSGKRTRRLVEPSLFQGGTRRAV